MTTTSPRWTSGETVYSPFHGANVPVVRVHYLKPCAGLRGMWLVSTPGYTTEDRDFGEARPDAPTFEYRQLAPDTWARTHEGA